MEFNTEIKSLFRRGFVFVKNNVVLTLPFFVFWLLLGFVLLPLATGAAQGIIFTLLLAFGLKAAFLSGWLNMFKKCVETPIDQNTPDYKHTYDSFTLFKEFFPGVGMYFWKSLLGIIIVFVGFNFFMLLIELIIIPLFGSFNSFSHDELVKAMQSHEKAFEFWRNISPEDQSRIFKIAIVEVIAAVGFLYFMMFWPQIIILKNSSAINAIKESFFAVKNDLAITFTIFFINFVMIIFIFFSGTVLIENPLARLLLILLFVYALVFYVMVTFVYLEKRHADVLIPAETNESKEDEE